MNTFLKTLLLAAAVLTGVASLYDFYTVFSLARVLSAGPAFALLVMGSVMAALSWYNFRTFRSIK